MNLVRALVLPASIALGCAMLPGCDRPEQAPSVGYTLLDGRHGDLAALRGRVVLVNFWATDCAPCVAEMPELAATWQRFAHQGFDVLAVSMRDDPPALVANFAQARALPFGVAIDNTGEIAGRFGDVNVTPTSLLIDRHGVIVRRWIGSTDFQALDAQIQHLLQAP